MSEFPAWYAIVFAVVIFLWVFPLWRIVAKAGYPPAIALFAIFPALGLILLWWLAFARWPISRGWAATSGASDLGTVQLQQSRS
jgi:hypothetical protein